MADLRVDVDTAVVVPVNIFPLTDNTDFKTREQDVAYNATGMDLVWNFTTPAGVTSCTAVTPTTGGVYDWSETVANKGMYQIEIPASGGATINNDTEGCGWFTGLATGVLPWRGPTIEFASAHVNDALTGTDKLQVHVDEITNNIITAAAIAAAAIDNATFAADVGSTAYATNIIALAVDKALDEAFGGFATTDDVADAVLNRDFGNVSDTNDRTALNALRAIRNKTSITGSTLTVTKENDSTAAWTAAVTTDADAEPITAVDPA